MMTSVGYLIAIWNGGSCQKECVFRPVGTEYFTGFRLLRFGILDEMTFIENTHSPFAIGVLKLVNAFRDQTIRCNDQMRRLV